MIAMLMLVTACYNASGVLMAYMLSTDNQAINVFKIKPEKGNAALVEARTYQYASYYELETFPDKRMIGRTRGKSYFV